MNSQPLLVEGAAKFVAYINVATGKNITPTTISLHSRWNNIIYLICRAGDGISLHRFPKERLLRINWGHILKIGKKISNKALVIG